MLPFLRSAKRARTLIRDTFTRTASIGTGIGNADSGLTWTLSATGLISVNGSQLVAALTAGASRNASVPLASADSDTTMPFQFSALPASGTTESVVLVARSISTNEQLRSKLNIDDAGVMTVRGFTICPTTGMAVGNGTPGSASETGFGTTATLTGNGKSLGTVALLNTVYLMRQQVKAQRTRIKVWRADQKEPSSWDFDATQAILNVAGGVGWRLVAAAGTACTFTLDEFVVRSTRGTTTPRAAAVGAPGTLASIFANDSVYANGSTVYLAPGTYYENGIVPPAGRVLTLVALVDGTVTISAYAPAPITAGWAQVAATPVYSIALASEPFGVMVADKALLKFTSLANLTNAKFGNGSTDASTEGFFWTGGTLYLRLASGTTPTGTNVYYTRSGLDATAAGTGITVRNDNSITFEGIRFHGFPRRALYVEESGTLIARRCEFPNCWRGVEDSGVTGVPTSHIRLEYCLHTMGGASGAFNGPFGIMATLGKNSRGTSGGTNGLYGSNLGDSKLAKVTCDDFQAYRCICVNAWDGIDVKGRETASDYGRQNRTSYIRECLFWRLCDNGSESETGPRYIHIEIDHNTAVDCFQPYAMAPSMAGTVELHHNVALITGDYPLDAIEIFSKATKHSGAGAYTSGVQSGLSIYKNTFILGRATNQRSRLWDADVAAFTFNASIYRDNIAIFTSSFVWELGGFVLDAHNLFWHGGSYTGSFNANHYKHASVGGTAGIWDGTANDTRPTTPILSQDPLLGATSTTLFTPQPGSPVLGAASDGGALGAVEAGQVWTMPLVGSRSAAATALLPAAPVLISGTLMGL